MMGRHINRYVFVLLFQAVSLFAVAQKQELKFTHLSVRQGLSQANVTVIHQDRLGFIWIGTEDGLNLYDGSTFTIFKSKEQDSTTISDNEITSIAEDREGGIWIATVGGLNRYDRSTNKFQRFTNDADNNHSLS